MVAKVVDLEAARARRCLRADGTKPAPARKGRRPDARLALALAAVARMERADFDTKLAVFQRVWGAAKQRRDRHAEDPG